MLVTFSGCDGAGKSTQILELMKAAKENNLSTTFVWSRGGYTPIFQFVKGLLLWVIGKKKHRDAGLVGVSDTYTNRRRRLLKNKLVVLIF